MNPLIIGVAFLLLLSGCASQRISTESIARKPLNLEPPKDGKIIVLVSGNATQQGKVWVQEGASLATLEDLVGVRPEWASRSVVIYRSTPTEVERIRVRIAKMTRKEKDAFKLHHGDNVCFVWDRCFG